METQSKAGRVGKMLFGGLDDSETKTEALFLLAGEKSDIDGAVRFSKRVAERGWAFESLWWRVAEIIAAAAVADPQSYKLLFEKTVAVFDEKFTDERSQRVFVLGGVLGLLDGAVAGNDFGIDTSPLFANIDQLVFAKYSEVFIDPRMAYPEIINNRYETRISQAIKGLVKSQNLPPFGDLRQSLISSKLLPKDSRTISRLSSLFLEQLSYALLGRLSPEDKILLVLQDQALQFWGRTL